jgi:hypothetical protein
MSFSKHDSKVMRKTWWDEAHWGVYNNRLEVAGKTLEEYQQAELAGKNGPVICVDFDKKEEILKAVPSDRMFTNTQEALEKFIKEVNALAKQHPGEKIVLDFHYMSGVTPASLGEKLRDACINGTLPPPDVTINLVDVSVPHINVQLLGASALRDATTVVTLVEKKENIKTYAHDPLMALLRPFEVKIEALEKRLGDGQKNAGSAAVAARAILTDIKRAWRTYKNEEASAKDKVAALNTFQDAATAAINFRADTTKNPDNSYKYPSRRDKLETHRGMKQFLSNLLIGILSLATTPIYRKLRGWSFFEKQTTSSGEHLDKLQKGIEEHVKSESSKFSRR